MEYNKKTKQELLAIVHNKDLEIEKLSVIAKKAAEIKLLEEAKANAINAEFSLRKENEKLKKEIEQIKSSPEYTSGKEKVATNESLLKSVDVLAKEKAKLKEEALFLENKIKELAELFDDYVRAYQDQLVLVETILRAGRNTGSLLELKIKKFNNNEGD